MKIKYKNSMDDFIFWGIHSFKKDPSIQKKINLLRVIVPIIFTFMFILIVIIDKKHKIDISLLMICIIINFLWIKFYPKIIEIRYINQLKKTFSISKRIYSEKTLIIDDNGIINESKYGFSKISWDEIERFENLDEYLYVVLDDISTIIIPSNSFRDEKEKNELIKIISDNIKK